MEKKIIVQTHPKMFLGEHKADSIRIDESSGKAYTMLWESSAKPLKYYIPEGMLLIEGVIGVADILNENERMYPFAQYEEHIEKLQPSIRRGLYGEMFHPDGMEVNIDRATHRILEIRIEANGNVWGKFLLLDNKHGLQCQSIVRSGGCLPVSSRGYGSIDENNVVTLDVLATWDTVNEGGFSQALMRVSEQLTESKKNGYTTYVFESKKGSYKTTTEAVEQTNKTVSKLESKVTSLESALEKSNTLMTKMLAEFKEGAKKKDEDGDDKSDDKNTSDDKKKEDKDDKSDDKNTSDDKKKEDKDGKSDDKNKSDDNKKKDDVGADSKSDKEGVKEMLANHEARLQVMVAERFLSFVTKIKIFLKEDYTNFVSANTIETIKENNTKLATEFDSIFEANIRVVLDEVKGYIGNIEVSESVPTITPRTSVTETKGLIIDIVSKAVSHSEASTKESVGKIFHVVSESVDALAVRVAQLVETSETVDKEAIKQIRGSISSINKKIAESVIGINRTITENSAASKEQSETLQSKLVESENKNLLLKKWMENEYLVENVLPLFNEDAKNYKADELVHDSYVSVKEKLINKNVTHEHVSEIDEMLNDADNMTFKESTQITEGFESTKIFRQMPNEYTGLWATTSQAVKSKIEESAKVRNFTNEKSIKAFWEAQESKMFHVEVAKPKDIPSNTTEPVYKLDPNL